MGQSVSAAAAVATAQQGVGTVSCLAFEHNVSVQPEDNCLLQLLLEERPQGLRHGSQLEMSAIAVLVDEHVVQGGHWGGGPVGWPLDFFSRGRGPAVRKGR